MTWRYQQSTGKLFDPSGAWIGTGYSGNGQWLDQPSAESIADHGPIPCGMWTIGAAETVPHLGPVVMAITPEPGTQTFGRSGFFCHGDNAAMDHTGSCGCIVLPPADRQQLADSADRQPEVFQ